MKTLNNAACGQARAGGFRGAARLGSIGAAWLLLLGAPGWLPPAEAQDTCAPLYGEDIWCTTMTVAQMTTRVSGFSSVEHSTVPTGGSLADATFTYAGTNYTVRRIQHARDTTLTGRATGNISFDVRPLTFPPLLDYTNLGLHVGSTRLLFDHAEVYFETYLDWPLGLPYIHAAQFINWPEGEPLIVRIFEVREPAAPPLGATVGDWQATLAWRPPADDGGVPILGYEYRYRKQTDAAYPESWTELPSYDSEELPGPPVQSVTLRELDAVPYVFQVRARNGKYPGPPAEVSATPTEPSNVVSIEPNQLVVREDAGEAVLTVSLDPPAESALSVPWRTQDDRAEAPNDYGARQDTVTFAVGETRKTISVPIVDDALREDPVNDVGETFFVLLSSGQGYGVGDGVAIVEIRDDDVGGPELPRDGTEPPRHGRRH